MSRYGRWRVYAQHECLLLIGPCHSGDYIIPAMGMKTCPRCGGPCDLNHRDTWARVVRRRVSDAVWHRPTTWGRWHWEYRQLGHLEEGGFDYRATMRNARAAGGGSARSSLPREHEQGANPRAPSPVRAEAVGGPSIDGCRKASGRQTQA